MYQSQVDSAETLRVIRTLIGKLQPGMGVKDMETTLREVRLFLDQALSCKEPRRIPPSLTP